MSINASSIVAHRAITGQIGKCVLPKGVPCKLVELCKKAATAMLSVADQGQGLEEALVCLSSFDEGADLGALLSTL